MIRIVADDKIPFLKGGLDDLAEVIYLPGKDIDNAVLRDADALLTRTRTKCTEFLLKGTRVRFIGSATIGFDHIDTRYCNNNKIYWTNAPGCNSSSVQQYIATALLKIAAEFKLNLRNKTLGIVGVGNVGSKVEKFAKSIGMNVLLCDPPRARREGTGNFVNLADILKESDIVTVHVPLNFVGKDKTYHFFNEKSFNRMKQGAWFLNSSRGEVVETASLKKVLESDKLGGSVLDVWENEPDIDTGLMAKSFIATPHIAGYSADGKAKGTAMTVNSLCKYFSLNQKNWYPEYVPPPPYPDITINCSGKSDQDIIREAVLHTYNIAGDDQKLRLSPSDFEKQRGDYPLRREFNSYQVHLKGGTKKVQKVLEKIGFKIASGINPVINGQMDLRP